MDRTFVTIVSGLPRSGTSMMMQMLQAGGVEPLTDGLRGADEDNPRGYYEFERVKQLATDASWVAEAAGKVVKIVSPLLKYLPPGYDYRIVFMRRAMPEVLASQRKMLARLGDRDTAAIDDVAMGARFEQHLREVDSWMASCRNAQTLYVPYSSVVEEPVVQARAVRDFLAVELDVDHMASAIDPALYRERG